MFPAACFDCMNQYRMACSMPKTAPIVSNVRPSTQSTTSSQSTGTATANPPMTSDNFEVAPGSPTILDTQYTQGYLKTQIGKSMRVDFLIGTNIVQDRDGILTDVGISYIILTDPNTKTRTLCDIYSIKFVTIRD